MKENDSEVMETLYKKAIGYTTEEIVEEYGKEEELLKKKISYKHIPPDLASLKAYIEINNNNNNLKNMTIDELKKEKLRLIKLLKEKDNENN